MGRIRLGVRVSAVFQKFPPTAAKASHDLNAFINKRHDNRTSMTQELKIEVNCT